MQSRAQKNGCFALVGLTLVAAPAEAVGAPQRISAKMSIVVENGHLTLEFNVVNSTRRAVCFTNDSFALDRAKFYDSSGSEVPNHFNGGYSVAEGMMVDLIAVPPDGQDHSHSEEADGQAIFGQGPGVGLSRARFELIGYNCDDLARDAAQPRVVFRQSLVETVLYSVVDNVVDDE